MIYTVLLLLTGCSDSGSSFENVSTKPDSAAIVFGPSLTELFYVSGIDGRLAGVDRFSIWPDPVSEIAKVGDFLSPSLEQVIALNATSIHVVGSNSSLEELANRLSVPYYRYSFDTLDDVFETCSRLEELYSEANFDEFRIDIETAFQSALCDSVSVMLVIYLEEGGSITLAGEGTFYQDILEALNCTLAAPQTGTYPSVSVEGILSINPDFVILLDPYNAGEALLDSWSANGLDDSNVSVLSGDYVLIPGARLPQLILEISSCLH